MTAFPTPNTPSNRPMDPEPGPPAAPREITPLASRRAWLEPGVRLWWVFGLVVLLSIGAYAADNLRKRATIVHLIESGIPTQGKVLRSLSKGTEGQLVTGHEEVTVQYDWKGRETESNGNLDKDVHVGGMVAIRVDPNEAGVWTDRTTAPPLGGSLMVGLMMLPLVPLLLVIAYWRKRGVLNVWRNGTAAVAVVTERRQSALAPLAQSLKCVLRDGGNRQVFTTYVPGSSQRLNPGNALWVLTTRKKSGELIAVDWMLK